MSDYSGELPGGVPDGIPGGALAALGRSAWLVLLAAGIAAISLGVFVLAWPGATLLVVGVLFGIYLLVSGVTQLAASFGPHVPAGMRALSFVTGALSVLLGLICFRSAAQSLLLLALWIGFGWLLRGITMVAVAVSTEGLPARGWQLFFGAITLLGGIVLIVSPFGSLFTLTVVSGVWLIVLGAAELVHAIRIRSLAAHRPA